MVCYCDTTTLCQRRGRQRGVASDDYLEAMQIFVDRVQSQIDRTKAELCQIPFDKTVFTKEHCIPDDGMRNIVGKVVVINSEPKRYEYQHPAYQLVLADGGNGAIGGRGRAVFGTCLATGEQARWERYDVLGEIKPECMPDWAKEALAKIKAQEKKRKSRKVGRNADMEIRALTPAEQKYTYAQSMQLEDRPPISVICVEILTALDTAFIPLGQTPEHNGKRTRFKTEFDEVINALRSDKYGLLKNRSDMSAYARQYADCAFKGAIARSTVSEWIRRNTPICYAATPTRGDYNFIATAL